MRSMRSKQLLTGSVHCVVGVAAAAGHTNHDQLTTNSGVHCSLFWAFDRQTVQTVGGNHCIALRKSNTSTSTSETQFWVFSFVAHKDKCKNKLTQIFGSDKNQQLPSRRWRKMSRAALHTFLRLIPAFVLRSPATLPMAPLHMYSTSLLWQLTLIFFSLKRNHLSVFESGTKSETSNKKKLLKKKEAAS